MKVVPGIVILIVGIGLALFGVFIDKIAIGPTPTWVLALEIGGGFLGFLGLIWALIAASSYIANKND